MTTRKHALLIGINDYLMLSPLKYARNDAEAVGNALRNICGFSSAEITLMTCNAPGPQRAVVNCIESALKAITDEQDLDLLVFGFWGHGCRPSPDAQYLCGMDTREAELERTGLPLSLVQTRLRQAGARDTLVLLDCCQNQPVTRGGRSGSAATLERGVEAALDAMARDIIAADTPRQIAPTVAVMNACREGQRAYEWEAEHHGIFTWYLLDGLQKGRNSVGALGRYLGEEVPRTTRRICNADQVPFIKIEGLGDIVLGVSDAHAAPVPPPIAGIQWFYTAGDREIGPVSEGELVARITAETEVWRPGMDTWARAGTVSELRGKVRPPRRQAPAPITPPKRAQEPQPGASRTFSNIEMVWVPPGTFMMGYLGSQHQVTLTQGFWLGKYPVTQAQWEAVMGNNPSQFKGDGRLPVERVSWDDCQAFCRELTQQGQGRFRLPTEAEWEYACRAGSTTAYCFGDDENRLGDYAWYCGNSGGKTALVGTLLPNAWGLHDMHGNVLEWCQDWYGDYPIGAVMDPTGPNTGSLRVFRGGGWGSSPGRCRSANRGRDAPESRGYGLGFRLALPAVQVGS